MQRRYGGVFQSNDAIAGETFHIAERDLVEQMFKWKPAQYNVGEPRQVMEPVILSRARLAAPRDKSERTRFRGVTLLPSRGGEAVVQSLSP